MIAFSKVFHIAKMTLKELTLVSQRILNPNPFIYWEDKPKLSRYFPYNSMFRSHLERVTIVMTLQLIEIMKKVAVV